MPDEPEEAVASSRWYFACVETPCPHQAGLEKLVQALAIASGTTVAYVRWQYGLDPEGQDGGMPNR